MKQYEYVHLKINRFAGAKLEDHRQIVDEYARRGFRYVGFLPTSISDYGKIKELDLIFEND